MSKDTSAYIAKYSESKFFAKVKKYAKRLGDKALFIAFCLYEVMQSPNTPAWAKAAAVGALGYLISPLDTVPDVIPAVGFTDDVGVLVAAGVTLVSQIDDNVRKAARERTDNLKKTISFDE